MNRTIIALIFVALFAPAAHSQPEQKEPTAFKIIRVAGKKKLDSSARAELATLYLEHCRTVLNAIPTNTPAEQSWVTEESRTTDTDRMIRLVQTAEYARSQLKETFSECVERASSLLTVQSQANRNREAALFVSLAATFNESSDAQSYAARLGVNRDELKFPLLGTLRRILLIAALRTLDGT
jgi:hypothetical protein